MKSHPKNRLAYESSAYLQQHGSNPVDWYPWGSEALQKSKKENKPIFLSIGYSACHWCHVMERESFEDSETAEILKKHFVSIKVDREERPDLDHVYMAAVQALTHRGGWPLNVFLTPSLQPFYGGTYFPPQDRMGMPSFKKVLLGIAQAWKNRPEELLQSAQELTQALSQMTELGTQGGESEVKTNPSESRETTARAYDAIYEKTDHEWGGVGSAPKFFHTTDWRVVLRHWKNSRNPEGLSALENTLDQWSRGGIYDHLGGGFHRYSTDREWLVPHFEKMLYDNALVVQVYLEAFQATHRVNYARVVRETLDYVCQKMTSPLGGYFSTEDADSEGVEGKFYVWSKKEIEAALSAEDASLFCDVYGVTERGNWEGVNILHLSRSLEVYASEKQVDPIWLENSLTKSKRILLALRSERVSPHRDEKVILAWNGLMIESMARAYQVLDEPSYLDSARNCALFVEQFLKRPESGELYHCFQDGKPYFNAYLDDYAYFINGLLALFESDFDPRWIKWAEKLADTVLSEFWDSKNNDFFFTGKTYESLIFRPKEYQDGALPSATGMMVSGLVRLGKLNGNALYLEKAEKVLTSYSSFITRAPLASGQFLLALELLNNKSKELVLVPGTEEESEKDFLDFIRGHFYPNLVTLLKTEKNSNLQLLQERKSVKGLATAYLCENRTCLAPFTDLSKLKEALDG